MTKRLLFILLLSGLMLPPALAQNAPKPRVLVRAWLASQAERGRDIGRVELHEKAQWTLDGPFGVRRLGWEADVAGGSDVEGWQRDPISATIDGRAIPLSRWEELDKQRRGIMGPHAEPAARAVIQLHQLVATMRPSGDAILEEINGVPCWRVEMVPRTNREQVERYTLWFARREGHLVRSRALVRPRRNKSGQPLVITTTYTRVEGFDAPQRRLMEGTTQTRRRLRTYTLLYSYEAVYSDYRLFSKE